MELKMQCKIIADSINPWGHRLTTLELMYPRIIHEEILTHRDRERNSMSSRAIPVKRMIERAQFTPIAFGLEEGGMQTGKYADGDLDQQSRYEWDAARKIMKFHAQRFAELGIHKSIPNRLLHPFQWFQTVMSATCWNNFFRLRCHPDAEIHFQILAEMMRRTLYTAPVPRQLEQGDWHLPYIQSEEKSHHGHMDCAKVSAARCARVSYKAYDGTVEWNKDMELFERLKGGSGFGHWSPVVLMFYSFINS